jgi:hypothetical protein
MELELITLAQSLVRIPSPSGGEGAMAGRVHRCIPTYIYGPGTLAEDPR